MADKIPVYGELDCRTSENIIADAEQIRYDTTKNVKEAIDDKMSNPSNTGTIGQVLKKTASGSEWQNESGGGTGISTIKYTTSVFTGSKDLGAYGTHEATLKLYLFSANKTTLSGVLRQYGTDVNGNEVTSATLTYKNGNGEDKYLDVIKCVIAREEDTFKRIIRVTFRIITEVTGSTGTGAFLNNTYETVFYEDDNTSFTYVDIA